jgi:hypothetical protein
MGSAVGHHELGYRHHAVETSTDRSFGLVFAAVFALLAFHLAWAGRAWSWVPVSASVAFLTLALVRPSLLSYLNFVWTKLGQLIGAIVAPIVMAIIFFAIVTPMGLLGRMIGKDPLRLRRDPAARTYWLTRHDLSITPERLRNQF